MNSFYLKIIACISMFMDHLALVFSPAILPLTYIGRFAFPIFAFQASLGYEHTKNFAKYILRLLVFALISQIPFKLFFNNNDLNVIFTIMLGVIGIYIYDKMISKNLHIVGLLGLALIAYIAEFFHMDYGCYGVFLIFLFYIAKDKKFLMILGYIAITVILFINKMIVYGAYDLLTWQLVFTLFAIIPILFYNGKQGKKTKYALYIFYPLHIILLYLLKLSISG